MVGVAILRYDAFGDTVNVAARMEASGEPMKIHISEATAELLQNSNFIIKKRGKVEVKVCTCNSHKVIQLHQCHPSGQRIDVYILGDGEEDSR